MLCLLMFAIPSRGKTILGIVFIALLHSSHPKLLSAPHLTPYLETIPSAMKQRMADDPLPEVALDEVESSHVLKNI